MKNRLILAIGINTVLEEKTLIQEKLKEKDISLDIASIKDPVFYIVDGVLNVTINDKDLTQYDYVWVQSGWNTTHMAYLLHMYLKSKGIPHNETNTHNTKLSDILALASQNVSVPNTFFHNGLKIDDKNILKIEEICNFPCIYKTSLGSLGNNVYLIDNKEDIKEVITTNGKYNRYIFQEYIPNDFDYRVVIVNGRPTSVCKRTRVNDEYRNNVALGATEEFLKPENVSKEILDLAIKATEALGLDWAGVDIVTDNKTDKNYVLEVNRRPGLTVKSTEIEALYSYVKELI